MSIIDTFPTEQSVIQYYMCDLSLKSIHLKTRDHGDESQFSIILHCPPKHGFSLIEQRKYKVCTVSHHCQFYLDVFLLQNLLFFHDLHTFCANFLIEIQAHTPFLLAEKWTLPTFSLAFWMYATKILTPACLKTLFCFWPFSSRVFYNWSAYTLSLF